MSNDTFTGWEPAGHPPIFLAIRTCIITLFALLTILGNIFVLVVNRRVTSFTESTKILIACLAVNDLAVGIGSTFSIMSSALDWWPYGQACCEAYALTVSCCFSYAIFSIMLINTDRFIAVTKPYKFPVWCSQRNVGIAVAIAVLVSVVGTFMSRFIFGAKVVYFSGSSSCYWGNQSKMSYLTAFLLGVVITFIVIVSVYYHIIKISQEHEQRLNERNNQNEGGGDNKALKTFLAVTIVWGVCYTPLSLTRVIESFIGVHSPYWLDMIVTWILACNSLFNVFIYSLFNKSFRKIAKTILSERLPCCNRLVAPVDI